MQGARRKGRLEIGPTQLELRCGWKGRSKLPPHCGKTHRLNQTVVAG